MGNRIDPPFNVKDLMEYGQQFHYNTILIRKQGNQEMPKISAPLVVCSAFALEVYFKVLTNIERNILPLKTHNLLHLFNDISPDTQRILNKQWTDKCLPTHQKHATFKNLPKGFVNIQTLRQAIELSSDAFVDWRYTDKSTNRGFHLFEFMPLVRDVIVTKRPDLRMPSYAVKPLDP